MGIEDHREMAHLKAEALREAAAILRWTPYEELAPNEHVNIEQWRDACNVHGGLKMASRFLEERAAGLEGGRATR